MYLGSEHRGIGLTGDCHVRVYVSHLQLSVLYFMFVRCKRSIPLAQRSVMQNMIPHNCLLFTNDWEIHQDGRYIS